MTSTATPRIVPQLPLRHRLYLRRPASGPRLPANPRDRDDPSLRRALARLPEDLRRDILRDL